MVIYQLFFIWRMLCKQRLHQTIELAVNWAEALSQNGRNGTQHNADSITWTRLHGLSDLEVAESEIW